MNLSKISTLFSDGGQFDYDVKVNSILSGNCEIHKIEFNNLNIEIQKEGSKYILLVREKIAILDCIVKSNIEDITPVVMELIVKHQDSID